MSDELPAQQLDKDEALNRDLADFASFLHMAAKEYFERKTGGYTSHSLSWDEDTGAGLITTSIAQPNHAEDRVFEISAREVTADTAHGIVLQDAAAVIEHRSQTGSRWSRPTYPGQPRICSMPSCEQFGSAHDGDHTRKPLNPLGRQPRD